MVKTVKKGGVDLDAQIAALEAALGTSDPSSDGPNAGDSDAPSSDDSDDVVASKGGLIISSLSKARIPPLAAHLLPASKCSGSITSMDATGKRPSARSLRRSRPSSTSRRSSTKCPFPAASARSRAPRSRTLENIRRRCSQCAAPCRRAVSWRILELGVVTRLWTDQSHCRLCRAQCTRPLELRVHLTSKKYLERLSELSAANEAEAPPPLKRSREA
ncbi:hypothetical protein M885DRAFT_508132 [Pelagophyceae sp. CCMP2097]|nr:hypothetical protein M885DRAFT_508132 [Pelagophyceae sp. CCMP2097]